MTAGRLRPGEQGFVLIPAVIILFIVLMLGVAILRTSNVETHQSGHEIAGEAALTLAESALDAETMRLNNNWPTSSATAFTAVCNQSSTPTTSCPGTALTTSFASQYAGVSYSNPVWNIQVLDDPSRPVNYTDYYSDALAQSPTTNYDLNGDNRLWLRADATVWGQEKIVVAQVVRGQDAVALPQSVITSGGLSTENNGNKIIIEAKDPNSNLTGPVNVRCADSNTPSNGDPCLGWDQSKGQLDPTSSYQAGYTDPNGGYSTLSAASLAALKATAQANGTYYNGTCPTSLTGLVYVENAPLCSYKTAATWNSDAAPGALIFGNGTLEFNGTITYTGIIYMANGQGTAPASGPCTPALQNSVITVHGGGTVNGGIFVDKCGTVDAGERKFDINFDANAFSAVKAWATPALAKNTFRIIPLS